MRINKEEFNISKGKIDMTHMQELRKKKGYNQTKMQHLVGITQQSITGYETGLRIPSLPIAYRLSEVLGCSIDYLVGKASELDNYYLLSQENKNKVVELINDLYKKAK